MLGSLRILGLTTLSRRHQCAYPAELCSSIEPVIYHGNGEMALSGPYYERSATEGTLKTETVTYGCDL